MQKYGSVLAANQKSETLSEFPLLIFFLWKPNKLCFINWFLNAFCPANNTWKAETYVILGHFWKILTPCWRGLIHKQNVDTTFQNVFKGSETDKSFHRNKIPEIQKLPIVCNLNTVPFLRLQYAFRIVPAWLNKIEGTNVYRKAETHVILAHFWKLLAPCRDLIHTSRIYSRDTCFQNVFKGWETDRRFCPKRNSQKLYLQKYKSCPFVVFQGLRYADVRVSKYLLISKNSADSSFL